MQNTLLLVDGSSYFYRAFHALPDMHNAAQEPTGALYGIIGMLRRLRSDFDAAYIACVFDAKGKTFRDALYPEYKATRKEMPPGLALQIPLIHTTVAALGWPVLVVDGVEADDVIGTLARRAAEEGLNTVISTGDKDMAQLVNPQVRLINTMNNEMLDELSVAEKFGVPPQRIVDYLTLVGDTVDNVPGVVKCGPKTAIKWLSQYGSLDGVMAHAPSFSGVAGKNLRDALEWLPRARELITIRTNVPLEQEVISVVESLRPRSPDWGRLVEIFRAAGFRTWLREAQEALQALAKREGQTAASAGGAASLAGSAAFSPFEGAEYETIVTVDRLNDWAQRLKQAPLAAFDTETDSLVPMSAQLVGLSFCIEPGQAAYVPVAHSGPDVAPDSQLERTVVLDILRDWLEDPACGKIGQNMNFDIHVLANHRVTLRGVQHDTMLQSYVLDSSRTHDMDNLSRRLLDHNPIAYTDICGKGASQIRFDQVDIPTAARYAAEDADVTLRLYRAQSPLFQEPDAAGLRYVYEHIEMPVSGVLQRMEREGVAIDANLLEQQSGELATRIMALERQAFELAGQPFNLGSPKQVGEILFIVKGLPVVKKTASGAPSTDEEVLQKLAENYPLPKVLLEHRSLAKLKSTYTDKLPRMMNQQTGRVHTHYAQSTAVTGRLASTDPNLQNIPVRTAEGRRIREAFIATSGHVIVSADYSQIELRIMAHLSQDEAMLRAFAAGEDIHRATAAEIFGVTLDAVSSEQRRYAKVINFGLIYGMSAFGLATNLGIERAAAQHYIDQYFVRFAGVRRYMDVTRDFARDNGYVETAFGRRLWLSEINSPNSPRRASSERAAINAPMQGTAADLIKLSMIAVDGWLQQEKLGTRMIMQVHDELVLEVPEAELALVKVRLPELMAGVAQLAVPLIAEVGVGPNWERAH